MGQRHHFRSVARRSRCADRTDTRRPHASHALVWRNTRVPGGRRCCRHDRMVRTAGLCPHWLRGKPWRGHPCFAGITSPCCCSGHQPHRWRPLAPAPWPSTRTPDSRTATGSTGRLSRAGLKTPVPDDDGVAHDLRAIFAHERRTADLRPGPGIEQLHNDALRAAGPIVCPALECHIDREESPPLLRQVVGVPLCRGTGSALQQASPDKRQARQPRLRSMQIRITPDDGVFRRRQLRRSS